jgi:SAM-dependent methyltransferase
VDFICGDAREINMPADTYDHVIIMGNSLGYIQEKGADAKILAEAYRVLRTGGWILVDVADGRVVKSLFKPNAWHEIGEETIVCRQREIQGEIICAREIVLSKAHAIKLMPFDSMKPTVFQHCWKTPDLSKSIFILIFHLTKKTAITGL